jgi:hypothetical protein
MTSFASRGRHGLPRDANEVDENRRQRKRAEHVKTLNLDPLSMVQLIENA